MKRRRFLGLAAATMGAAASAGCLGSAGGDGGVTDDRPVVDEMFTAGPTEPRCSAAGKDHFPPMRRRRNLVEAVPDGSDTDAVETFVRERTRVSGAVTIRPEKYATLGWRNKRVDLTERYDGERYYVGWVGDRADGHVLLVVVHSGYSEVIHYETGENC